MAAGCPIGIVGAQQTVFGNYLTLCLLCVLCASVVVFFQDKRLRIFDLFLYTHSHQSYPTKRIPTREPTSTRISTVQANKMKAQEKIMAVLRHDFCLRRRVSVTRFQFKAA